MGSNVSFLIFLLFEIQRVVEENPFGGHTSVSRFECTRVASDVSYLIFLLLELQRV